MKSASPNTADPILEAFEMFAAQKDALAQFKQAQLDQQIAYRSWLKRRTTRALDQYRKTNKATGEAVRTLLETTSNVQQWTAQNE